MAFCESLDAPQKAPLLFAEIRCCSLGIDFQQSLKSEGNGDSITLIVQGEETDSHILYKHCLEKLQQCLTNNGFYQQFDRFHIFREHFTTPPRALDMDLN
jgi:hypothetical protein